MKKTLCLLFTILLLSCTSKEKNIADNSVKSAQPEEIRTDLYGSWVGSFTILERDTTRPAHEMYNNKLNIVIKKITSSEVIGQSIVAGNSRPLQGNMIRTANSLQFILKEPGDDKNDGVFDIEIKNDTLIVGTWIAYNAKKEVTKRKVELTKKAFKYNPNLMLPDDIYIDYQNPKNEEITYEDEEEGNTENKKAETYTEQVYRSASESIITINSSTQKLKESDLKNLKKIDLEILRNTIFARHGLSFKTRTVRQFFDDVDWYIPVSKNVDKELTALEKENIVILKRFEKYATDNYDSFGR